MDEEAADATAAIADCSRKVVEAISPHFIATTDKLFSQKMGS